MITASFQWHCYVQARQQVTCSSSLRPSLLCVEVGCLVLCLVLHLAHVPCIRSVRKGRVLAVDYLYSCKMTSLRNQICCCCMEWEGAWLLLPQHVRIEALEGGEGISSRPHVSGTRTQQQQQQRPIFDFSLFRETTIPFRSVTPYLSRLRVITA